MTTRSEYCPRTSATTATSLRRRGVGGGGDLSATVTAPSESGRSSYTLTVSATNSMLALSPGTRKSTTYAATSTAPTQPTLKPSPTRRTRNGLRRNLTAYEDTAGRMFTYARTTASDSAETVSGKGGEMAHHKFKKGNNRSTCRLCKPHKRQGNARTATKPQYRKG